MKGHGRISSSHRFTRILNRESHNTPPPIWWSASSITAAGCHSSICHRSYLSSEFPLPLLLYVVVGIPLHLHQALMYLCSLMMVFFQHYNITRVGTSIESDTRYTIFDVFNPTARITPSLPLYNLSTIPIFHSPLCISSSLIKTISCNDICISSGWCNMLCLSLWALRYSSIHLVHAASLHLLIYPCRLFIFGTSSSRSSSGTNNGCPCSHVFGVSTDIWISSST